jgi:hypothetical protein
LTFLSCRFSLSFDEAFELLLLLLLSLLLSLLLLGLLLRRLFRDFGGRLRFSESLRDRLLLFRPRRPPLRRLRRSDSWLSLDEESLDEESPLLEEEERLEPSEEESESSSTVRDSLRGDGSSSCLLGRNGLDDQSIDK